MGAGQVRERGGLWGEECRERMQGVVRMGLACVCAEKRVGLVVKSVGALVNGWAVVIKREKGGGRRRRRRRRRRMYHILLAEWNQW